MPLYDSNGGGGSTVASVQSSAWTPSAETPICLASCFDHRDRNLRDGLRGDRELHRAHLANVVGAAEHDAHDCAACRRSGSARRSCAPSDGTSPASPARRRRCESTPRGRCASFRSTARRLLDQPAEHRAGRSQHRHRQAVPYRAFAISSSLARDRVRPAPSSDPCSFPGTPGISPCRSPCANSGSLVSLSKTTTSPSCSATRSRSETIVRPSSTSISTPARSTLRVSCRMSSSVMPRPATTVGDHWKSVSCWPDRLQHESTAGRSSSRRPCRRSSAPSRCRRRSGRAG